MSQGAVVLQCCSMRGTSNANPNQNLLLFWGCCLPPCLCETKVFQTGWIPFETEILKRPDDGGLHYGVEKLHMNGKKAPTTLSTVRRRHRITRSPSWTGMSRSWASFASERFAGLCMLCFACLPFIALCSCASSSLAACCSGDRDFRQATSVSSRLKAASHSDLGCAWLGPCRRQGAAGSAARQGCRPAASLALGRSQHLPPLPTPL